VASLLPSARHLVVLDHLQNPTTAAAELVLPAGTFAESDGTLVNNEGRAQRFFQVLDPSSEVLESWRWLSEGLEEAGFAAEKRWRNLDDLTTAMAQEMGVFASLPQVAPARDAIGKIAREPNRYSGRTAMLANISVHEPKPPSDPDSALAFSMEGGPDVPPPPLNPFFWAAGWNSIQATNKFQSEVGGPLRGGDPGIRLIEPSPRSDWRYVSRIPAAFEAQAGEWLIVPIFHIFGSEELSRRAPGIAQLAPSSYVALNPLEASRSGVSAGQQIKVSIGGALLDVEVVIRAELPCGVAGLPAGTMVLPTFCSLASGLTESCRGAA
jgi:NADH-quinone oxidoreductase subunit G